MTRRFFTAYDRKTDDGQRRVEVFEGSDLIATFEPVAFTCGAYGGWTEWVATSGHSLIQEDHEGQRRVICGSVAELDANRAVKAHLRHDKTEPAFKSTRGED